MDLDTGDTASPRTFAIRQWSFTTHADTPDGPEIGFPPLHNHHTTVNGNRPSYGQIMHPGHSQVTHRPGADGSIWLEAQADGQCPGEVDGFSCLCAIPLHARIARPALSRS